MFTRSILLFLFGVSLHALGEHSTDTLHLELKEVNVIASRTSLSTSATPRSVSVLTDEEIKSAPYLSLGNLLEQQCGIYMIGTGQAPGSNQSIFVRGSNSNQTAIFIDGVRITDVSTVNSVADLSELPIKGIQRIEILRGAQSTLYGSPASGGVILISTDRSSAPGFHGSVGSNGGIFKRGGTDAGWNGGLRWKDKKGFFINASGSHFTSRGFNATDDTLSNLQAKQPDTDPYRKSEGNLSAGYQGNGYDAGCLFRVVSSRAAIDEKAYTDDDNYRLDFIRYTTGFHLNKSFSNRFEMKFIGNWTSTERNTLNDSSLLADGINYNHRYQKENYTGDQLTAELTALYSGNNWKLTAGAGILQEKMNQEIYSYSAEYAPFIYESNTNLDSVHPVGVTQSIFLHGVLNGSAIGQHLERLLIMGGIRYQYHSICGENVALDISPSYSLNDEATIYCSFSNGFTTPSLYQLYAPDTYLPYDGQPGLGITLGNPGLQTELTKSFEVGLRVQRPGNYEFDFSFFRSRTNQLIDFVCLWDGSVPQDQLGTDFNRDDFRGYRYMNIGDQVSYGAEFNFSRTICSKLKFNMSGCLVTGAVDYSNNAIQDPAIEGTQIQLFSNGSFLDSSVTSNGLIRRPSTLSAALVWKPKEDCSFRVTVRHVGPRYDAYYDSMLGPLGALNRTEIKGYTLTEIGYSTRLTEGFSLTAGIDNLFNIKYQEILGFATRGIGLQLGLDYHF